MKNLIVLLAVLVLACYSCKTKQESKNQAQTKVQTADAKTGPTKIAVKTQGKVSHEYRATGCSTVVVVKNKDAANTLILIPVTALAEEFDKDGLTIFFNYRLSKIKNHEGCSLGIPAILTDISLK